MRNDRDPRFCRCGHRLERRGSYFSLTSGYHRYKYCPNCGRTYTTHEALSPGGESPTPTPA